MSQLGNVIPVFLYLFKGGEAIEHFSKDFDENLYRALPNLYSVCISDNSSGKKRLTGGFFIKTRFTAQDAEFADALSTVLIEEAEIAHLAGPDTSFLPSLIECPDSSPLGEVDMVYHAITQYTTHMTGGNA